MLSARLMLATAVAILAGTPGAIAAASGPGAGGATPVAKPGSTLAARADLSRTELRDELAAALAADGSAGGAWVFDTEAAGDGLLFSDNGPRELIPASNQKLFVTAALLDELGPTARLETRVYARGKLRARRGGVVANDLVLVGDGDPAFGTGRFARTHDQPATRVAELARSIAAAGVKRVRGRILADDTIFDRERRAGQYLSPLSGLSFNNGYDGDRYARSPELVAAEGLKSALRKRGIPVNGKVGRANLPDPTLRSEALASVTSPTIARLIEETNVPSNNFFAEMLLKRLAATSGKKGTRSRGNDLVEAFARSVGTSLESVDGSGLSRKNRVSPEHVGRLLVAMAEDTENAAAFKGSLPVAGREGTVADRMRGTAAEGNCATKTGTIRAVSALSGYCEAAGHTIAFSALMNDADIDAARRAQDRIAAAVARYEP
jgi:serine-type D-Ala-D-Ala carboxypeptidase/endopeptidase (penicillin-binding protein 4)